MRSPTRRLPAATACAVAGVVLLAGCTAGEATTGGGAPVPTPSVSTSPAPATEPDGLAMTCTGSTGPVVVMEAGLDTSGDTFADLVDALGDQRVCTYDRAGIGLSPPLPASAPDPWPGSAADALVDTLAAHDQPPPYVVLGWSYGGMVAQALAVRHPDLVAGVVLEDSSVPQQLVDRAWRGIDWVDGGRAVDEDTTVAELSRIDLGDTPLLVLSADALTGKVGRLWRGYHRRLAASSTDAVHVVALGSGHAIHEDAPDLVVAAVQEVVAAAEGRRLAPCDPLLEDVGGRCLG